MSLPLPMSPEAAAAAAAAVGVRASAAALQLLLMLLAADLASRWSQQAAAALTTAASASPLTAASSLGRDYSLRSCGETLSLGGLDWASVTWEPPGGQCSLTVLPGGKRRVLAWRKGSARFTPASACFIDLYRWLCLPEQPHCNTLVFSSDQHQPGSLLEPPPATDPVGINLGETDYVRLMYCGSGGTVLYLQVDDGSGAGNAGYSNVASEAGDSSYPVLLSFILPTLLVAIATAAAIVIIGVCARRRRLKRRQNRRWRRSQAPPSYDECVGVAPAVWQRRVDQGKPGSSLTAQQPEPQGPQPPPYELAVATISLGRMPVVESSISSLQRDNPAFEAGDDDQLAGESASVRMAVGRGMRAQYSRNSMLIAQGAGRCCRVTQV